MERGGPPRYLAPRKAGIIQRLPRAAIMVYGQDKDRSSKQILLGGGMLGHVGLRACVAEERAGEEAGLTNSGRRLSSSGARIPNIQHLRVWGSLAFVRVPPTLRVNKTMCAGWDS